jgi:signal transduction histidine kinase
MTISNKNIFKNAIKELMSNADQNMLSNETMYTLAGCFLETIIEERAEALILMQANHLDRLRHLQERLKFTGINVYSYSNEEDGFNKINADAPSLEHDNFFIILAERFSACLYWKGDSSDITAMNQGFCSLNPSEVKKLVDSLQTIYPSEKLAEDLMRIPQDRRNNEKFTTILRKIISDMENKQQELVCMNAELQEYSQQDHTEDEVKLAEISKLFSTVMHEVRNPLGSIGLHSRVISQKLAAMKSSKDNEDEAKNIEGMIESVEIISKTAVNLETMLTELLNFSKPVVPEMAEFNLEKAVMEIINLITPSYRERGVQLVLVNAIYKDFLLKFDRAKLHQVVFNLLKNALEVSKTGDLVEVLLKTNGDNIFIKVSDEGSGVPAEIKEKIFEPYFTTKKDGNGLGLAESRKLIRAQGGDLFLGVPGSKGAVFIISLKANPLNNPFNIIEAAKH